MSIVENLKEIEKQIEESYQIWAVKIIGNMMVLFWNCSKNIATGIWMNLL